MEPPSRSLKMDRDGLGQLLFLWFCFYFGKRLPECLK
jgi:hypothetical protein